MRFLHKTEIRKMIVSSGGLQQVRLIEDTDIVIIVEKKSGTLYVNEFKVSGSGRGLG